MTSAPALPSLRRFAWLSIAAAVLTIALKAGAYLMTGSVGLLSDALESVVNLVAAGMALAMLTLAERPEDDDHPFGHTKAEYFAGATEGALILVAAYGIASAAIGRLRAPQPLENLGWGLAISVLASAVNLGVARVLLRTGRRYHSITLEADAHHLLTDVWTSAGVLLGVLLVKVTGWLPLDSIVALLVAANIVWTGVQLVRRSASGLMDRALPAAERAAIEGVLARHSARGIEFHGLRTRQAGQRRFLALHVLVPGAWTVQRGHDELEQIERDLRDALPPPVTISTHLEPVEDPCSQEDRGLDRVTSVRGQPGASA
jgi:cation diffusion facilitator family transporter